MTSVILHNLFELVCIKQFVQLFVQRNLYDWHGIQYKKIISYKEDKQTMLEKEQWNGFEGRLWKEEINVRDFIQRNYTQYDGNEEFLSGPTEIGRAHV